MSDGSDRDRPATLVGPLIGSRAPSGAMEPLRAPGDIRGLHLHLDCASGAAGDMLLGALIDLGVPIDAIGDALDAIGAGRQRLTVHRVVKHGMAAADVKVDTTGHILDEHKHGAGEPAHSHAPASTHSHAAPSAAPNHIAPSPSGPVPRVPARAQSEPATAAPKRAQSEPSGNSGAFVAIKFRAETQTRHVHVDEIGDKTEQVHDHDPPPSHAHYHYADIRWKIARAPLTEGTRARALDIFDRLARAEAKLHGTTLDEVTFHEVGAIDSIVDVVGTAAALDWLRPVAVSCTSVAMGHGTLTSAHGTLPVPAPAALEVLREANGVMTDGGVARELCTPTGAAVLAATVTTWTPAPTARAVAVGWGAGDSDLADRPNVLRLIALAPATLVSELAGVVGAAHINTPSGSIVSRGDSVWQIDANLDDMSPELCGPASDALFVAGALDVWWTPITMKKGRPALTLSALVDAAMRDAVIAAILRETTTIGVRYAELHRTVLERRTIDVATRYGVIPVKVAVQDGEVRNAAPEYEACAAAARAHNVPVKMVFAAALSAYDARR